MKLSFITTVYNEEKTIDSFLKSLLSQTKKVHEIIIVDGGSSDATVERIKNYKIRIKNTKLKVFIKKGNRSVGRNEAIKHATGNIILCSDAGNVLDKKWVEEISNPFSDTSVDVVAGYYKGKTKNIFQKCLIPYLLVMPDRVDPKTFLPATRSIAFTKAIWKKAGTFPEEYSHNEDYVFARRLTMVGAHIVFAKNAIVSWIPRSTLKESFVMFYRFALGDIEARIFRPKILLLFIRYIFFLSLILLLARFSLLVSLSVLLIGILFYLLWSVSKNYRYVKDPRAFFYLPLIQLIADISVMAGSIVGLFKLLFRYLKHNPITSLITLFYIASVLWQLPFGTPNTNHPYLYHMDEWHQLMAIRGIVQHGTTTLSGSAEIPFLYPVLSGVYLIPFILLGIINPFSLKSSALDLQMQQRLFEILRTVNLYFGIGSILLTAKIAKDYLKSSQVVAAFFFGISPILISLSGYFKYDIGLLFFIILSLYFLLQYGSSPTRKNYIYASIASALAMSVKFSAIPLIPLLIIAFFWYRKKNSTSLSSLFYGGGAYLITFILAGIPNILIGKADYGELLYSNLISGPKETDLYHLSSPWLYDLTVTVFPFAFGHIAYFIALFSFLFFAWYFFKKFPWKSVYEKHILFLLGSFVLFFLSLLELKMGGASNRVLVLLPFIALFISMAYTFLSRLFSKSYRYLFLGIVVVIFMAQMLESLLWVQIKTSRDPQYDASVWIQKHIPPGKIIGIENIPIYQQLPNIAVKEFYEQDNPHNTNKYRYVVIDSKTKKLPSVIAISQDKLHKELFITSDKKNLVERLKNEHYKKAVTFSPDLRYYYLLGDDTDYFFSALSAAPLTVSLYTK